jgi:hypothetical protein
VLYSYYVGVDLGQKADYTAVAVLEEPAWVEGWVAENRRLAWELGLGSAAGWVSPADVSADGLGGLLELNRRFGRPAGPPLSLRHLERFPLGTPYPKIVERIGGMLASAPLADRPTALVVDATGVGTGVVDMFVHAGLYPIPVTIHGGDKVLPQNPGYRVPKRDLVAAVQVLLQNERLKIARALPEAETLRRELQNFRVKIDPKTAHDSYSHWREAEHDDLVLATALAAWFRGWWNSNLDTSNALTVGS